VTNDVTYNVLPLQDVYSNANIKQITSAPFPLRLPTSRTV